MSDSEREDKLKTIDRAAGRLDRVPPQDIDAERMILGAMMMADESNETVPKGLELLNREDFYKESHRKILDAIQDLFDSNLPVDLQTVTDCLGKRGTNEQVGGVPALNEMIESVPTAANLEFYIGIIKELATKRRVIYLAAQLYNEAFDDEVLLNDIVSKAQRDILNIEGDSSEKLEFVKADIKATFQHIQDVYNKKEHIIGLPTGLKDLDAMTAGFHKGEYVIIGARPSMGKSALLQNIATYMAFDMQEPVLLFSSEMSKRSLNIRLLASFSKVSAHALRSGELIDSDWPKVTIGAGKLSEAKLIIDDTPHISINQLRTRSYRAWKQFGIKAIFVDYIQELREPSIRADRKREMMDEISGGLKRLARELDIPVIVASQLSRSVESRPDKRPMLSDLRESGSLEQDADVVIFIYRDEYYNEDSNSPIAELLLRKQRNGPTGKIQLHFDKRLLKFSNLQKGNNYRGEPFI